MAKMECVRCGQNPETGAVVIASGPGTGFNTERRLLCGDCLALFRVFASPVEHVKASDPVTAEGLAHIATCPECKARFGGYPDVSRETSHTVSKQRVAERFLRGGQSQ